MLTTASGESSSVGLVESMVSNHMRSGKRLDLKMDDFSATTDVTKMLALRGSGSGSGREASPCFESDRYALSFSIFLDLESFEARISLARVDSI